ncbi:MAG TPA: Holliday junction branch migration protein RuvA [Candidatus Kaiserbacteria bacterium]|nr:Holliday junction branch migration protein RuvA [Candidatus Kaiserbacteria bacterium]
MIRTISGTVLSIEPGGVVVNVSGWGVFVHLAVVEPFPIGSTITLATHLAMKKDGPELYGFVDSGDRAFFELALTVPGLGPKTALSILRRSAREQLETAIAKRDVKYLTRVVGLGKKSAEKLVVELADKVTAKEGLNSDTDSEVFDMLVALGYTGHEARKALEEIPPEAKGIDERLKSALSANLK